VASAMIMAKSYEIPFTELLLKFLKTDSKVVGIMSLEDVEIIKRAQRSCI
jgi:hypothetical protein